MHSCLVNFLRDFSDTNLSQPRFLVPESKSANVLQNNGPEINTHWKIINLFFKDFEGFY